MNKRIKVLVMFILTFIIMMGFNSRVSAAKWSDLSAEQQNELIKYADKDATKDDVETICKYSKKGESKKDGYDAIKYLFIYKDNHYATVSFDGGECSNNDANDNSKCLDGYRKSCRPSETLIRGVRNWSANSGKNGGRDGVKDDLNDSMDAYLNYKVGECPTYMAEIYVCKGEISASKGRIYFFSTGKTAGNFSNLSNWVNEEKNSLKKQFSIYQPVNYDYFNVPIIASDLSNIPEGGLECHYAEKNEDEQFYFTLTPTGIKDVILTKDNVGDTPLNADPPISMNTSLNSIAFLSMIEKDKCPGVIWGREVQTGTNWYLDITGDTSSSINGNFYDGAESWQKDEFHCIGDNCSEKTICKITSELSSNLEDILSKYKSAEKNSLESKNILNDYNRKKSIFNDTCVSILKTQDYNENSCVSECLKLSEKIADLEETYGLRSAYGEEKCNIGEQVLSMVYNVLKWAKYIAPVLVIILSILDFIKALAAQSDDEMKKAQGKFVKRLIVAALLFLLPLIINFALKTFGMYNSSCDITDLF